MGGGSSTYRLEAGNSKSAGPRPDWLQSPKQKLSQLGEKNFENLAGIGKGKFGFVYLAKHCGSKKCVAIKYISKQFVYECKSIARINQEITLLQKIDHPFMVHCFGGFSTTGCIALVFEYCLGGEFFTYLKKRTKIPEGHAKFYFCEIALAIAHLHEKLGYVYRDLKPENILLDYDGHVRLCDFGFSVPVNKGSDGNDVPLNDGCGTAMYVAPEIAGGFMSRSHGYPVDWWGLGCVLAEMVTGNAPFGDTETSSKFAVFNNINEKSPALGMQMGGACKKLCKGLLDKDPAKRFTFTHVVASDWCKGVDWNDMLGKQVSPPWLPTLTKEPTTDNFVSWNSMEIPTDAPSSSAASYMNGCKLPRMRTSANVEGMDMSQGDGEGVKSRGNSMDNIERKSASPSPTLQPTTINSDSGAASDTSKLPSGKKQLKKQSPPIRGISRAKSSRGL